MKVHGLRSSFFRFQSDLTVYKLCKCWNNIFHDIFNISCRGSHRKQITQRSYTQPIPSIRINGASPPLNGTRQNASEPTGQLNGDISRNKYQAYSPTGEPPLPLPLILCKKKKNCFACWILFSVYPKILTIQESSLRYQKFSTNVHTNEASLWQSSGSGVVDEFGCLFHRTESNPVSARTLNLPFYLKSSARLLLTNGGTSFLFFGST